LAEAASSCETFGVPKHDPNSRFGVPFELTVDNGKQFDSQDFKDFCFSIGTKLAFASVYHPQSNGVVERANGKIFTAVKKMLLDDKKGKWADLLPEAV
jgi:transposase InsO family protein